jgi:uncharacterized protein YyaL (SSP411 family)
LLVITPGLAALAPATAPLVSIDGEPAAYVCENYTCQLPTTKAHVLAGLL